MNLLKSRPVNYTCPDGIRGYIRSIHGNGESFHSVCLDVLEMFSHEGCELSMEELGDFLSEQQLDEVLDFLTKR